MDNREDELRRAVARERAVGRIMAAAAAEAAARVRLFEEGIREEMRLQERLLAERAEYVERIAKVEEETKRIMAERDEAAAALGSRERRRADRMLERKRRKRARGNAGRG